MSLAGLQSARASSFYRHEVVVHLLASPSWEWRRKGSGRRNSDVEGVRKASIGVKENKVMLTKIHQEGRKSGRGRRRKKERKKVRKT